MTIETINIGFIANDGTGDDLRTAFEKVNGNFTSLVDLISASVVGENLGSGEGLYIQRTDNKLQFRSIDNGSNLSVTTSGNQIVVALSINEGVNFNNQNLTNTGDIDVKGSISLTGATSKLYGNVVGNVIGSVIGTIYVGSNPVVAQGNIVGKNGLITNSSDPGYDPATVDGIVIQDLNRTVTSFNFGSISNPSFSDPISYLLYQVGVDMGTITAPAPFTIEGGTLI